MRIGKWGRSEASLSSHSKFKGEMLSAKAFSFFLPQQGIIFDPPCRQINSQPSFHRHRAPSSSHSYLWCSCYTLKIHPTPLITQVTTCQKALLYPCTHLYKLFADLPRDFDHCFHFGRSLTHKTTHTNDPVAFRATAYFLLGWGCWEWMYGKVLVDKPL